MTSLKSHRPLIYLDHAAATPIDERVLVAMEPYFAERFYNPSALYAAAQEVHESLEAARRHVAGVLGARPAEIVFTAGGTEANNLAISGVMHRWPGARMATSTIEHESVLETAKQYDHQLVGVGADGLVSVQDVAAAVEDNTVLVSIMYANNEIGAIQPVREIGQLIQTVRRDRRARGVMLPLYFHTDAAQAANYLDLQVARLGVDLLSLNGGKIYGPKQSGGLYVQSSVELEPLIYGGGQERKLRSGTENVAAAVGFAKALKIAQGMRHAETKRLQELQQYFWRRLAELLPAADVTINGSLKKRLPNNLHITIPGQDNERLLYQLDESGILVATGSACSAASGTPSHVLAAIGLDEAAARSSLRLSMGRATDQTGIERTLQTLRELVRV